MSSEQELIARIGLAKARIDNGFSQVGRALDAGDPAGQALLRLSARAIAMANALALLCRNNHATEALPLLRSLVEIGARMRWVAQEDGAVRAAELAEESRNPDWESWWSSPRLKARMEALGFPRWLSERALFSCYDFVHGNAQGLPWSHKLAQESGAGGAPEDVLRAASAALAQALRALERHWPGRFQGAEETWEEEP